MQLKQYFFLPDLLKRFPKGFAVSPTGKIYEIVATTQDIHSLPVTFEKNGNGYIMARNPIKQEGDDQFFGSDDLPLSIQDFYKDYGRPFEDKEQAERTKEFLSERGVGLESKKEIEIKETPEGFRLVLI